MRGLSSTVLAAALLAVGPCADALAADTVEDIHRQCGEEYADPIAVAKCLTAEEKDYGKRLAATYQKVVELQTPDAKQVLIEAQRSWTAASMCGCVTTGGIFCTSSCSPATGTFVTQTLSSAARTCGVPHRNRTMTGKAATAVDRIMLPKGS
jgi:uncharacterized protein YecT (DUF1311 family)